MPTYPFPYISPRAAVYFVGDKLQLVYRWHDAFDVFVAVLEVYAADSSCTITLPVSSHLSDLHLVYQLDGHAHLRPIENTDAPIIELPEGHHFLAYTPPARALLRVQPAPESRRFAMVASVPKGAWLVRHRDPKSRPNPLEELVGCLRQKHQVHYVLPPTPISPHIRIWLHVLLTSSKHPGLLMDNAVHHASAQLIEQHRTECARDVRIDEKTELVEAARELVRTLVGRLDGDKLLTVVELASVMKVRPRSLWKAHHGIYGTSLERYINEQLMTRAKTMLDDGMTIKSVSLTLGYSTPNNFSRSFKKKYGISPSSYLHR